MRARSALPHSNSLFPTVTLGSSFCYHPHPQIRELNRTQSRPLLKVTQPLSQRAGLQAGPSALETSLSHLCTTLKPRSKPQEEIQSVQFPCYAPAPQVYPLRMGLDAPLWAPPLLGPDETY